MNQMITETVYIIILKSRPTGFFEKKGLGGFDAEGLSVNLVHPAKGNNMLYGISLPALTNKNRPEKFHGHAGYFLRVHSEADPIAPD